MAADALSKLANSSIRDIKKSVMVEILSDRNVDTSPHISQHLGDGYYRAIHAGIRGRKFLIVGIDYFTKWIEAESTTKITGNQVKKFIWQNIITRFGIPMGIVMDHGVQFDCGPIKSFPSPYDIKFAYSSVCHPKSNGQAELANKEILNDLKKKLDDLKGAWADMVPTVLWLNRTSEKEATAKTPFRLPFGAEAVLPSK
ncbi:uncharacterized protein LOC130590173 [Beta vulgaris subsp. vulgaris]|uniref:uncharacterized protein LOC130590173 n=1 Tax=Beta vulgaris subsp. vulgaris TaxID=3555 RepID=UPI0025471FA3|nr:uncharacterized protein LOC130590173 [Beta vulgaris subsp. vulgaris]